MSVGDGDGAGMWQRQRQMAPPAHACPRPPPCLHALLRALTQVLSHQVRVRLLAAAAVGALDLRRGGRPSRRPAEHQLPKARYQRPAQLLHVRLATRVSN